MSLGSSMTIYMFNYTSGPGLVSGSC